MPGRAGEISMHLQRVLPLWEKTCSEGYAILDDFQDMRKSLVLSLVLTALISCAGTGEKDAYEFIANYGNTDPVPLSFSVCYAHGCNQSALLQLTEEEWDTVKVVFNPGPSDAAGERERIAKAVGLLETIVGRRTGTDVDRGGTFAGVFRQNQMDCVDEAVNTGTYLAMMKHDGLIRFHDLRGPARRGYLILGGWPHIASVIAEKTTGEEYVVDSWFLDNGHPPFIIPLRQWKSGWRPSPESP
jgi:hypothetical protein